MTTDIPTEQFGNDTDEIHAIGNGVFVGATGYPAADDWGEPHYWKLGFLAGRAANVAAIAGLVLL